MKRLTALLLCAALLLSGCRYSDVLAQIIYDLRRGQELDLDAPFQPEENDPENEDASNALPDLELDEEAERAGEPLPDVPLEPEEPEEPETPETPPEPEGAELEHRPEAEADGPAASEEAVSAQEDGQEEEASEPPDAGPGGEEFVPDAALQTVKQVVDAYGRPVEIPEDVDRVAAAGPAAVMVMMLSGPERLAASGGELVPESLFPGLDRVPRLWNEEGVLGDGGLAALLELAPDVVIETSGSASVTVEQARQLAESGIAYLVLPACISPADACTAMTTLGTVLGDRSRDGGTDAPRRAAEYVSWVEEVSARVARATAGRAASAETAAVYTLYVDGWDDDASYRLCSDLYVTLSGTGFAVVKNGATASCKAVSNYLALANVVNTAAQYGITPKTLYFAPLVSAYRTLEAVGPAASGMVTAGQKLLEQADGSLGTANFPILLTADRHTAQAIAESELWAVYPHINSGDGSFHSDGFLDEEGNLVRTQISGDYEIVVNPRGASSWTQGSAESILESVWAAWRFFDAVGEDEMRSCLSDFYRRFYGYALTEAEIDQILEGP